MMAELERDIIQERTKEVFKQERGIMLRKPKSIIQISMYYKDKVKIENLYQLGVPLNSIINTHFKYGGYLSLKYYIVKDWVKKMMQKNNRSQVIGIQ